VVQDGVGGRLEVPTMTESAGHTAQLQGLLERLQAGDERARGELLGHAAERLRHLSRKMLRRFPRLRRWEQTDDVLQNATLRLHRALAEASPESPRHFYNLAALQVRRELLDMSRHHFGPLGQAAHHHSEDGGEEGGPLAEEPDGAEEPATLEGWARFHEQVEALPEPEREAFNLLWYEGLTQEQAAEVLGVGLRTVKRRWQKARLLLYEALHGEPPQ
jgi:RNA polymerase sigma-70 factor (ECF subfamily)